MSDTNSSLHPEGNQKLFNTTLWTVVVEAAKKDAPEGGEALERLCRIYWNPIKSYIQRWLRDRSHHDAEDLTQAFFAQMLHRNFLKNVSREHGKFRSFLLKCVNHFLRDQHQKATAQKRGGGVAALSLDAVSDDGSPFLNPADQRDAVVVYERRWVEATLDQVIQAIEKSFCANKKADDYLVPVPDAFQILLPCLLRSNEEGYVEIGQKLGKTEGAVKQEILRLKIQFERFFRESVSQTLTNPGEFDDEVRYLLKVLES